MKKEPPESLDRCTYHHNLTEIIFENGVWIIIQLTHYQMKLKQIADNILKCIKMENKYHIS